MLSIIKNCVSINSDFLSLFPQKLKCFNIEHFHKAKPILSTLIQTGFKESSR